MSGGLFGFPFFAVCLDGGGLVPERRVKTRCDAVQLDDPWAFPSRHDWLLVLDSGSHGLGGLGGRGRCLDVLLGVEVGNLCCVRLLLSLLF